jgi:hypothetical protein
MAKGKLSSYSRRKPKKQKTFFGFKVGTPPKSDYQKKVLAGASVFKTGAGGKIATDSKGKISSFTSTPPQQITKEAPHHNIYKPVPKVKTVVVPRTGIAPPSVLGRQSGGTITTKDLVGSNKTLVSGQISKPSLLTSTVQPPPPKPKRITGVLPPDQSPTIKMPALPVSKPKKPTPKKPTLFYGQRHGVAVKSAYQGGEQEARKILSKGIGTGSGRATSTTSSGSSKPFKSLLKFLGVGSGTSGGTRGSYSGGTAGFTSSSMVPPVAQYLSSAKKTSGIKRTQKSSIATTSSVKHKPVSFKLPADNYQSVVGGKVKMKELIGTNTQKSTGVMRNRTGKSSPITASILNWWKQKGIDQMEDDGFMKARKTLPKNYGGGSY